jgi:hypothetical protein
MMREATTTRTFRLLEARERQPETAQSTVVLEFRDLLISAKFGGIATRKTRSCLFACGGDEDSGVMALAQYSKVRDDENDENVAIAERA